MKTSISGVPGRFGKHFVRHRKMSVKVRGKIKGGMAANAGIPHLKSRNQKVIAKEPFK